MPDADSTRKRSRSPSDSEQQKQHKRANTGATSTSDEGNKSSGSFHPTHTDLNMTDTPTPLDDHAASPSGSHNSDKNKDDRQSESKSSNGADGTSKSGAAASGESSTATAAPPSAMIHMRCLIVTQDASIIIGKGGTHVNDIREKSGARVMVSESIPGNPERILNVSGPLDAVSKVRMNGLLYILRSPAVQAFGLIVRRINDEPFDVPSVPGSRAVTIKFMIPNSRMGSVIGKQGSKIKEIQDASGARLNASEGMLPGSTEVSLGGAYCDLKLY